MQTTKTPAQLEIERAGLINKLRDQKEKNNKTIQKITTQNGHYDAYIEILERGPYPGCLLPLTVMAVAHATQAGENVEAILKEFQKNER